MAVTLSFVTAPDIENIVPMSQGLFTTHDEASLLVDRADPNNILGSYSKHGFLLDGHEWPSVEHYFQANKFQDETIRDKIRNAPHPAKARKLGRSRLRKIRSDWKRVKTTIMTRAVYTKCRTHPAVAEQLLKTGTIKIVENSQYDYFWGCGRDGRGENHYGVVLMNVREKLVEEQSGQS